MSVRIATCVGLLLLLFSAPAAAQDQGVTVGGSVSATNMDSHTSWSVAGSFEYRLNRVVGLELEATAVPKLKAGFPSIAYPALRSYTVSATTFGSGSGSVTSSVIAPTIFPAPRFENQGGRAVFLTNNVRVHIPTTIDRLDPYFVAGGGIASVRRTVDVVYSPLPLAPTLPGGVILPIRPITQPLRSSSIDLALTLGGGVSVRAASRFWIEADLRLFRLMGDEDRNVGRFGVGGRYRF